MMSTITIRFARLPHLLEFTLLIDAVLEHLLKSFEKSCICRPASAQLLPESGRKLLLAKLVRRILCKIPGTLISAIT